MPHSTYKYYDFIMAAFVTVLLCSNLMGATKLVSINGFTFGAGVFFFPISYLCGDVLTEVYGYAKSRRVVWAGLSAIVFASIMSFVIVNLPAPEGWERQVHVAAIFGQTPRIVMASLVAYFCGEFMNSFVLAKMKILTKGKHLWMRTIGSTVVGEAVDTGIFVPLAFLGVWETHLVFKAMMGAYVMKVAWEIIATPFTYKVIEFLKREEGVDFYDTETDFSPFSLKEK